MDSAIAQIADALGLGEDGWISVFAFYGDDSGSAKRDKFCVVAGYLATTRTWFYDIETPWTRVLENKPGIEYFKSYECETLTKQFARFCRTEADLKRDALVNIIAALAPTDQILEFSSVVARTDYETAVTGKLRDAYPDPYYLCVHGVVSLIARAYLRSVKYPATRRVAYVFDNQSNLQGRMSKQYNSVRDTAPEPMARTMGSLSFDDDRRCPPLQVADLIAWHIRRDFDKPSNDQGQRRPALCALRKELKGGELALWNPDKLRAFSAEIEAGRKAPDFWASTWIEPSG